MACSLCFHMVTFEWNIQNLKCSADWASISFSQACCALWLKNVVAIKRQTDAKTQTIYCTCVLKVNKDARFRELRYFLHKMSQ